MFVPQPRRLTVVRAWATLSPVPVVTAATEDHQREDLPHAGGPATVRPRSRVTAPVLATHAAERVPSSAVTSCRCHEPGTSPAPPMWGLGTHQGRATGLNVTIAATTLAGLDDLPGELDGHGTIPADLARALAASAATITAVAVNPTCGTALDLGRTVYRPRQSQRDYVNQRDQTCRFPSAGNPRGGVNWTTPTNSAPANKTVGSPVPAISRACASFTMTSKPLDCGTPNITRTTASPSPARPAGPTPPTPGNG